MLTAAAGEPRRSFWRFAAVGQIGFFIILVVASFVDLAAGWALNHVTLSYAGRLTVALLPVPGNLLLIALVLQWIRTLDEFQKRLHFEAVVVAFLLTGVGVFVYGYLRRGDVVPEVGSVFVWLFMAIAYGVGYVIAVRHYQ